MKNKSLKCVYMLIAKGNKNKIANAYVKEYVDRKELYNYDKLVCVISNTKIKLIGEEFSQTTARHIKYFLQQNNLDKKLLIKRIYMLEII